MRHRGRALLRASVLVLPLLLPPVTAHAQVFLAGRPHPQFAIGPLFVVANVRPDLGPVNVSISWSLTAPPGHRAGEIGQDLFLLWPNEVVEGTTPGSADPALAQELEQRGFAVGAGGRLLLGTRDQMQMGTGAPVTPLTETASFVTFARRAGPAAQLGSSTYIKIPWTPKLGDPRGVTVLSFPSRGLVTPKPATWFEEAFWGRRWVLAAGFGDIGPPSLPLFPLYFEHRDRVVRLGRELSLVVANFADAEHLRIEEVGPASATRRPSRLRAGTELVTMPLAPSEGIAPQLLKVQFSYFTGMIAWRPIVISAVLLALGNLAGFILLSRDVSQFVRRRLHVRRGAEPEFARLAGGALPRTVAEQIVPGTTTEAEVRKLCGRPDEEHHRRGPSQRRTLVYRGARRLPSPRRTLGRLATVHHWEEEQHELEVELDGERVSAVQSRVRRRRATR
jgi:hypothetical protein